MAAIGLGLALAVSVIAVPTSGARQVPNAEQKKNLTIMIAEKDAGWCNQDSPGIDQISAKNLVMETLTKPNDKGQMVPYLAEKITTTDNKTWTVKLRPNIFFSNGEELTTEVVSLNWLTDLGLNPAVKGSLPAISAQGHTVVQSMAQFAQKIKIVDKLTIQITLDAPEPGMMGNFWAEGRRTIGAKEMLTSKNCGTTVAIGTGPYTVLSKGIDPFKTLLKANPKYWRKSKDGSKLPKTDNVVLLAVLDGAQRANALRTGQADIATFGAAAGVQINNLKKLKNKVTIIQGARDKSWTIHFNTILAPFNNLIARQAFAYAFDRATYVKVQTAGNATPANALANPTNVMYTKSGVLNYDLAKAKAKVAEYKAATGKDIEIAMPIADSTESAQQGTLVCNMMIAAGMKCTLMAPVTSAAYIQRAFVPTGQQLTFFSVLNGAYADFGLLFVNGDLELSRFSASPFTKAIGAPLSAAFMAARATNSPAAYQAAMATLQTNVFWTPGWYEGGFVITTKKVTGIGKTPLPNGGFGPVISTGGFEVASAYVTK